MSPMVVLFLVVVLVDDFLVVDDVLELDDVGVVVVHIHNWDLVLDSIHILMGVPNQGHIQKLALCMDHHIQIQIQMGQFGIHNLHQKRDPNLWH